MRKIPIAMITLGLVMLGGYLVRAQNAPVPPPWAYPMNPSRVPGAPPASAPEADRNAPHTVPGSDKVMTLTQIRSPFDVPDWHPEGHPTMPEVVARGRRPDVRGCGYCHYPNGKGRPENAGIAGLPAAYIIQQMADFKPGFPIWLWYFCPFDQSSSLDFREFLERNQATEGDTQWVNYKRSPFSSRSTDF